MAKMTKFLNFSDPATVASLVFLMGCALPLSGQALHDDRQAAYVQGRDLLEAGQTAEGLEWMRKAATNGLLQAQIRLAKQLWQQDETSRAEALHWALLAGRQGDSIMRARLISDLRAGDSAECFQACWPWLQEMADRGDPAMAFKAGIWAYNGYGRARNLGLAFTNLLAANQSESFIRQTPQCAYLAGYLLENGYGTAQNYQAAASLYWKAAERGWPEAVFRLGLLLEHGQGMIADLSHARLLYTRAAELGNPAAAYRLGILSLTDGPALESRRTAFGWFLQAATNGLATAQAKVGLGYVEDWLRQGTDPVEALAWFTIAAHGGNRGARIREEKFEREISAAQQSDLKGRISRIQAMIHRPGPIAMSNESLLPEGIATNRSELLRSTETPPSSRPRRLSEAGLARAAETNEVPMERRDDLQTGLIKVYLDDLQDRVRRLVNERLSKLAEKNLFEVQNQPAEMEIILSYRLLSDGHIEDVEVLDTNLGETTSGLFVTALQDSSPTPRWTPRLRAELNEDYQDLLLAFGRKSGLRISQ
jgi:TPR repeat protein